ncbi:MAG: molybdate ABC transporter substrate-binding protein [Geobacteraceae bacterium]|nr:molybdate ABC transporter substrate-binding protein [Geobacteraceae bacterium]
MICNRDRKSSAYERIHPEVDILPNFASSGALARQLSNGAPAHIYISANPKWMSYLEKQKRIETPTKVTLVQNSLVFAGLPAEGVRGMESLPSLDRIAMCNPASSPAGHYIKQALKASGIYTQLERDKRLIFAKDVRQALLYADRGEVDGAFVYRTDALLAQHAQILFQVDPSLHPQIVYPAAMTPSGTQNPAALDFFAFLQQETARTIFRNHGFIVPLDSGS